MHAPLLSPDRKMLVHPLWEIVMVQLLYITTPEPDTRTLATLMQRLGELFFVRDVMIPVDQIVYVPPRDEGKAIDLVSRERYSVVPASEDGVTFDTVFDTYRPKGSYRVVTEERPTTIRDYIPDWTPLAEAISLFKSREWYLTIRGNQVAGLMTYWAFNKHEFRIQLYVALSYLEELSRDALATDQCGVSGPEGLNLTDNVCEKVSRRFELTVREFGGNRFVDELEFHHIHDALKRHRPWRDFLCKISGICHSNTGYEKLYGFTELRNAVMHGRLLFPTYQHFQDGIMAIDNMMELIHYLSQYHSWQRERQQMLGDRS